MSTSSTFRAPLLALALLSAVTAPALAQSPAPTSVAPAPAGAVRAGFAATGDTVVHAYATPREVDAVVGWGVFTLLGGTIGAVAGMMQDDGCFGGDANGHAWRALGSGAILSIPLAIAGSDRDGRPMRLLRRLPRDLALPLVVTGYGAAVGASMGALEGGRCGPGRGAAKMTVAAAATTAGVYVLRAIGSARP